MYNFFTTGKEHGIGFFVTAVTNGSLAHTTGLKVTKCRCLMLLEWNKDTWIEYLLKAPFTPMNWV